MGLNKIQQQMLEQPVQDRLNKVDEHTTQLAETAEKDEFLANSSLPVAISTYDNSNQVVHPCVHDNITAWRSYRYWMAMTPYPNTNDDYENPSLRASNDGLNWEKVANVPDPVVPAPADVASGAFNSDPFITIINGTMYMFYRVSRGTPRVTKTYYITSTDAITWTAPIETTLFEALSPSFYHDGTLWHVWYVEHPTLQLKYGNSSDLVNWTIQDCSHDVTGYVEWHLEVRRYGGLYEMLLSAYEEGRDEGYTRLFHLTSSDRITWTSSNNKQPIIKPNPGSWDSKNIYKASFVRDDNGYRVWYSSWGLSGKWYIGYSSGKKPSSLRGLNINIGSVVDLLVSRTLTLQQSTNSPALFFAGTGKHIGAKNALHLEAGTDKIFFNYNNGNNNGMAFYGGTTSLKAEINGNGEGKFQSAIFDAPIAKHVYGTNALHVGAGTDKVFINYNNGNAKGMGFYGGTTTQKAEIDGSGNGRFQSIGVGNALNATTLGTVVKKMEVFDKNGTSLGFVPIYNSIT